MCVFLTPFLLRDSSLLGYLPTCLSSVVNEPCASSRVLVA